MLDTPDRPIRQAPHSIEAEQALLGAILIKNGAIDALEDLRPEEFYDPLHGQIFDCITKLYAAGKVVTPVTLKTFFENAEPIEPPRRDKDGTLLDPGLSVPQYLGRLVSHATTTFNAREYARTVRDLAKRREMILVAEDMANWAYDSPVDMPAEQIITDAESALFGLVSQDGGGEATRVSLAAACAEALQHSMAAYESGTGMVGIPTGLRTLDNMLGGIADTDLIILGGRPGMGKAQPLDASVLMQDGSWRAMGDLRLGDALASHDGKPSRVAGIFPQGERQVYRVTFSDGRSTECCDEHLWRVHYRHWDSPRVVSTSELRRLLTRTRYQKRLWVDSVGGDFGHNDELPIHPYALGALIGDGSFRPSAVKFTTASAHVLDSLRVAVGAGADVVQRSAIEYSVCTPRGQPNPVLEAVRSLGLSNLMSDKKFVPEAYKQASRWARLELIRGLMDTDGWVEKFGAVCFGTTSRALADDFVFLVRSIGGVASVSERQKSYTHNGEKRDGLPFYVCGISYAGDDLLVTEPHKASRVRLVADGGWRRRSTIASVVPTRVAQTQCIRATHPDSLYVTDDFIVTHNTALATNIACYCARQGLPVDFYSMEMGASQLANRLMGEHSQLSSHDIRRGSIKEDDYRRVIEAIQQLERLPLSIERTGGLSIAQLATKARRHKRQNGTRLIVVDYLQLMRGSKRDSNRVAELTEITVGLKALAKELRTPIIALSQLSRKVEERTDKRPQLSDLRESGSIEQDADVVMFSFREEYYVERERPADTDLDATRAWEAKMAACHGKAEVIIGKQRHGPTGIIELQFDARLTRFSDLARDVGHNQAGVR